MIWKQKRRKNVKARVPLDLVNACFDIINACFDIIGVFGDHKNRIVDPSIAMQVRVPVRHAAVSMLIRLGLISGCGTGV